MKAQEAIEILKGMQSPSQDYADMVGAPAWASGCRYVYPEPEDYAIEEAITALEEKQNRRWVPVTERLPELHRDVLVAVCDVNEDDASTFIDCLVDNNDRPTWSMYNGALDRVLAWMPLPDRYRPE